MNINVERFLALTAMLAAPLVAAPGCIINSSDDTNDTNSSNSNGETVGDSTGNTTNSSESTAADASAGSSGAVDTSAGDTSAGTTAGDTTTAGTTGGDVGNCCTPDDHGAGCDVAEINDCVCGEDPVCCDMAWDMFCVMEVNDFGCGTCVLPPQPWDCYCTATCNGTAIDTPFQVCGTTADDAAPAGTMACEQALMDMSCMETTCSDCSCSTAEVPEITC
jgi:hypothetical protein